MWWAGWNVLTGHNLPIRVLILCSRDIWRFLKLKKKTVNLKWATKDLTLWSTEIVCCKRWAKTVTFVGILNRFYSAKSSKKKMKIDVAGLLQPVESLWEMWQQLMTFDSTWWLMKDKKTLNLTTPLWAHRIFGGYFKQY